MGQDGVSMSDFKKGRVIIQGIMKGMMDTSAFEPLAMSEFFRMNTYSKETQTKMKEAWSADQTDPQLFAQLLGEFLSCFKQADVNNNGVLEKDEFRVYMTKM